MQNKIKYSGAVVVAIIYISFIVAILNVQNPVVGIFVTIGINIALLFVIVNLGALLYGIITRNRREAN
ncbi:MAG: hypothetical protein KKD46_02520 [Euryarchaeota archaeon]|nr:hypothetical protein [Euryarchaeota archaeon]MBU4221122.1 hypothetical protein [Euryarchaeota archaeon]MBU4339785.1 hypothetical protein [Euryarchaeota archaeon]MBU4454205.1 hypothetical protein [Euryarchaeota archaeon]MCG2737304.1 hypothetical protein [Candidatus Methanoperedenaceae archaeon]